VSIYLNPNAKINLGLRILSKRPDAYHEIETLMYPIPITDSLHLEMADELVYTSEGVPIPGNPDENLCVKAFKLLQHDFGIAAVHMHLHKQIPIGAGLGGGSSDAAFVLKGLNQLFQLDLSTPALENYAALLGSDCPFFITNKPALASGRGEVLQTYALDLAGLTLVLVKPPISVGTAEAYSAVKPNPIGESLASILQKPIRNWQNELKNDFEDSVFPKYPIIREIKSFLYKHGAIYASMSGSGSSVFGLFEGQTPTVDFSFGTGYQTFVCKL
jgi:4-diphosphocytidyl-2-C-methyl-D-erythritol kinase